MKLKTFLICLTLLTTGGLASAQGYSGDYNPGNRYNQPQNSYSSALGPTGYVAVNIGWANVDGSWGFAYSGVNSEYYGYGENYAQTGSFESISAGIPINGSNFGIALRLGLNYDNPFDVNDFVSNAVAGQYPNQFATNNYPYVTVPYYEDYNSWNIMGGLFYTYPIGRLSIDLRGMIGYMRCRLPEIDYDVVQNATPYNIEDDYTVNSSSAGAFAYDIGAGLRYSLRRYYCVMLNLDYLAASIPFNTSVDQTHYDQNNNISGFSYGDSGTLPLSLFDISIGFGFQFGGR